MVWVVLATLMVVWAGSSMGQARVDGMAGAGSAVLAGVDAPLMNPARLAEPGGSRLRLMDLFGGVSNNSFNLRDYRLYNGKHISETDERKLLDRIPNDEFSAQGALEFEGPGVRFGPYAVQMRTRAWGRGGLPKELARLILEGNTPDETFVFDATSGAGEIIGEIDVSHARDLDLPKLGRTRVGVTLKGFRGFLYGTIRKSEGEIRTTLDGVTGSGLVHTRSARGGNGLGLDIGAWRLFRNVWSLSLAIRDLGSGLRWTRGTKETRSSFVVKSTTVQGLEDGQDLVDEKTETESIGAFRTTFPPLLAAGVARTWGRWTLAGDWTQGFRESIGTTRTPRLAVGCEARAWTWLTFRAGLSIGGLDRHSTALGLGLSPGPLRVDLSLVSREGLLPLTGKGIGAGLALKLDL